MRSATHYFCGWQSGLFGLCFVLMSLPVFLWGQDRKGETECPLAVDSLVALTIQEGLTKPLPPRLDSLIESLVASEAYCCAYRIANSLYNYYSEGGDVTSTKDVLSWSFEVARPCGDPKDIAYLNVMLASAYANLGMTDSSLWYANRFIQQFEPLKDSFPPGFLGYRAGEVYFILRDYPRANRWYSSALEEIESSSEGMPAFYPYLMRQLVSIAEQEEDHDRALGLLEDLIKTFDEQDSSYIKIAVLNQLARNQMLTGEISSAVKNFEQLWEVAKLKGYPDLLPVATVNLGWSYENMGDTATAITWYQRGLSSNDLYPDDRLVTLQHLSELQAAQGSHADAYQSLWDASMLWDTINVQIPQARIQELVSELDSTVHRLEEAKTREQNIELRQQRGYLIFSLAIVFLIGLVFVLLALLYRRRQLDQQKELEKQREESQQKALALMRRIEVESLDAMLQGQDQERSRIAADLHDSLGGTLAAVKISLTMLQAQVEEHAQPAYQRSLDLLEKSIQDVRRISHDLGDNVLLQRGLHRALVEMTDSLSQHNHFEVDLQLEGFKRQRFSNVVEVNLYRIVQELMQNIIKHAQAKRVSIQLSRVHSRLSLIVQDDGRGMDTRGATQTGMGMRNLQARVEKLKGTLEIDSKPGEGTTVIVQVPIPEPNRVADSTSSDKL